MNRETEDDTIKPEHSADLATNGIDDGSPPTPDVDSIQVKQEQKRPKLEKSRESSIDVLQNSQNQQPMHEIVGGSSVRRYLNEHLTKHLLEGLKEVSQVKPEDPLLYLGEFLLNRSEELKK
ncbi:hypothetical protein JA1_004898 [Spathaspora sp. JA1]|nr:hypothetical protein JA1_004898 [Spathaspora sp. JA1]